VSTNNLPFGILKATPEDFVVQELVGNRPMAVPFSRETRIHGWDGCSPVTIFEMSKCGCETEAAEWEMAQQLGVSIRDISHYGTKDKQALTSQLVGVRGRFQPDFSHPDISLVQLPSQDLSWVKFHTQHKLAFGGNYGNRFNIFIHSLATKLDLAAVSVPFPNLFGTQRLNTLGTEQIGRLFLEGKPEQAIDLLLTTPSAKKFLRVQKLAGGSWEAALSHPEFERSFRFEIMKWQSFLWNKLCQEKFQELGDKLPETLPMWNLREEVYEMYRHLWDPPYLNDRVLGRVALSERPTMLLPENFQAKREAFGWRFSFDIPSGSFATVVLPQLFQLEEHHV